MSIQIWHVRSISKGSYDGSYILCSFLKYFLYGRVILRDKCE